MLSKKVRYNLQYEKVRRVPDGKKKFNRAVPISQINRFWISAFAGMTKKGTLTLPCTEGEEICNIYSIIGI
jgi:hypothetical protein